MMVAEGDTGSELPVQEYDLNKVIDSMAIMAWSSFPDGRCDYANQRWLEYGGVSLEQVQDWGWAARLHPDDMEGLVSAWKAALASGETVDHEARILRHDGVYRWFLFLGNPLRNVEGSVVRWFGVNVDVEDRVRAQEELRASERHLSETVEALRTSEDEALAKVRAELTYMTRVASMAALTASIAHEVNQPLAGIVTNANTCLRMLAADPPNIEGATRTSERIIRDSHRAADVITRLRALFAKKQATNEPVDLNEATREVIALHTNELRRHRVTLRTEFASDLPSIRGDRVQLQQVILNLLLNASSAMSAVDDRPRELVIETEGTKDIVRLSVRDSGVGVGSEEAAERLFEPFPSTRPRPAGWVSASR
jgi:PAS domain S-box-containing protein